VFDLSDIKLFFGLKGAHKAKKEDGQGRTGI